jgi:hypothetical protein
MNRQQAKHELVKQYLLLLLKELKQTKRERIQ